MAAGELLGDHRVVRRVGVGWPINDEDRDRARDERERKNFWAGRKSAFPALGRIAPDYYCIDGTIPRRALPEVLMQIERLSHEHGLAVANVFHAGDGNLHPLILYDANRAGELERAMGILGVTEWENLGYHDSDMMGRTGNHDPRSFWQADLDEVVPDPEQGPANRSPSKAGRKAEQARTSSSARALIAPPQNSSSSCRFT